MRGRNEKDFSTEQVGTEAPSWVSCKDGNCGRPQGARSTQKSRTPRPHSVKLSKKDFLKLKKEGKRFTGKVCYFSFLMSPSAITRMGLTVTKKFGKAHDRNRFKRWCREVHRHTNFPKGIEINISPILQSPPITFECVKHDFQKFFAYTQQRAVSSNKDS